MTQRSDLAYENWKTTQEKFDYFILGVIGAFCAYVSQTINLEPLGINSSTVEFIALLVVLLSGVFGYLRIEAMVQIYAMSHHQLHLSEKKGQLVNNFPGGAMMNSGTGEIMSPQKVQIEVAAIETVMPDIKKDIKILQDKIELQYKLRNLFLLGGFIVLLCAKVLAAYEMS